MKKKYEKGLNKINFWRIKDKVEVGFIVQNNNDTPPIEVKYSKLNKITVSCPFRSFINKYSPKTAYIVNLTLYTEIEINNTIKFISYIGSQSFFYVILKI